ncbi:MAG TPA: AraC family transcriptional regulator [Enteractinococcus sp.]
MSREEQATSLPQWQQLIGRSFIPMSVFANAQTASKTDFNACIVQTHLGAVGISNVVSDAHTATRTARDIRLHPADYYKVSIQLEGTCRIEQKNRITELHPGMACIYDVTHPYSLDFPGYSRSIVIQIPRSEFSLPSATVSNISVLPFTPEEAFTHLIEATLERNTGSRSTPHRAAGIIAFLSASLSELNPCRATQSSLVRIERYKRYATAHLSNPDLRQEDVANANFVSVRQMQRVFQEHGLSFAVWLKEERLSRAHKLLVTTTDAVTMVAIECGFSSLQHFSRVYKERYGEAPALARKKRQMP